MFEKSEEVQAGIDAVYAILVQMKRGDVLEHGQIEEVLGLRPHEGRWNHIVHRALDRLEREKGIAYWSMHNVGYELLTEARTFQVIPLKRAAKAHRQYRRAARSLERTPATRLTPHLGRVRQVMIERLKAKGRELGQDRKALALQLAPTGGLPRRPAPV